MKVRALAQILFLAGVCAVCVFPGDSSAHPVSYRWPDEAIFSDRYRVFVGMGDRTDSEVQVLMSPARFRGDYRAQELEGRTFSFVPLCLDRSRGPLTIRIVKTFGDASGAVSISPRSYGIRAKLAPDGREATFRVERPSRYISVNFSGEDNRTARSGWIRHMLCIFVDPPESEVPSRDSPGVVVYSPGAEPEEIEKADVIYFGPGYHNLRDFQGGGIIDGDGKLMLQSGQSLYLAGGAFVEGIVDNETRENTGQRIFGRGLLTGRQYLWRRHPDHTGRDYRQIMRLGTDAEVSGVTIIESPSHGIVGGTVRIENVKMLGWHCNNDCVRVGSGSEISNSFFRAVDDHFYNFNIYVHDVVLWVGHNGAILTYGWGGQPKNGRDSNTYNSGSSLFENIDMIHPEWTALGNNNGLVAAQVGLDYKPFGYGGQTTTVFRNIRIEGTVPGLINLKPRSAGGGIIAVRVPDRQVGYLGDLIIENVSVDGQSHKSRIQGRKNASRDGNSTFYVRNVYFRNLQVGRERVTESSKDRYFDISEATTRDISFE